MRIPKKVETTIGISHLLVCRVNFSGTCPCAAEGLSRLSLDGVSQN